VRPRPSLLVALLVVAGLPGCGDQTSGAHPARPPWTASATGTAAPNVRTTPERVVRDPRSVLVGARVRPTAGGLHVVAWWRLHLDSGRTRQAIATSDDGFATATYDRWTLKGFYGATPAPERPEPPAADHLLAWPLPTLVESPSEGTMAYALGGDGATLFPFERTSRSTDGGETWTTYDVARVDDELAYLNGGVVLSDGRLLVLLGSWSNDRPHRPSNIHHGLWVSEGDDWGRFTPWEPTYSPPLDPTADGWHTASSLETSAWSGQDVIWSVTSSGQLYVSTDDGGTFTAIPAR
jgi:hypothetical protein